MKTFLSIVLVLFISVSFAQRKSIADPWDKWDWINYAESVSKENAQIYLTQKLSEFKKHCKTDSVLMSVRDSIGNKTVYYQYAKPPMTFEYFIEWIHKNNQLNNNHNN